MSCWEIHWNIWFIFNYLRLNLLIALCKVILSRRLYLYFAYIRKNLIADRNILWDIGIFNLSIIQIVESLVVLLKWNYHNLPAIHVLFDNQIDYDCDCKETHNYYSNYSLSSYLSSFNVPRLKFNVVVDSFIMSDVLHN